ncbi:MAG: hypothetical protein MJ138_08445 [Kiritimatiellae bacterium]|nr:hypothetical protein [Kiritimatiellia bacterium]
MDGKIPMGVSAAVSCALVALALVAARRIGAPAFDAYRERGGGKGFWAWFARDACGLPVPGIDRAEDEEPGPRRAAEGAAAAARGERMRAAAKKAAVARAKSSGRGNRRARKRWRGNWRRPARRSARRPRPPCKTPRRRPGNARRPPPGVPAAA